MRLSAFCLSLAASLVLITEARSDFAGSRRARHALSPDGQLLVRITTPQGDKSDGDPKHEVVYYQFDSSRDAYVRRSHFQLTGHLSQMLFISDSGDLIMVSLHEKDAVRLYTRAGRLAKSWNLDDFLTKGETDACALTGSTVQWFQEGAFYDRRFQFRGPSQLIRAVNLPFSVMRGVDDNVEFSGSIDAKAAKLEKDDPDEP